MSDIVGSFSLGGVLLHEGNSVFVAQVDAKHCETLLSLLDDFNQLPIILIEGGGVIQQAAGDADDFGVVSALFDTVAVILGINDSLTDYSVLKCLSHCLSSFLPAYCSPGGCGHC